MQVKYYKYIFNWMLIKVLSKSFNVKKQKYNNYDITQNKQLKIKFWNHYSVLIT